MIIRFIERVVGGIIGAGVLFGTPIWLVTQLAARFLGRILILYGAWCGGVWLSTHLLIARYGLIRPENSGFRASLLAMTTLVTLTLVLADLFTFRWRDEWDVRATIDRFMVAVPAAFLFGVFSHLVFAGSLMDVGEVAEYQMALW